MSCSKETCTCGKSRGGLSLTLSLLGGLALLVALFSCKGSGPDPIQYDKAALLTYVGNEAADQFTVLQVSAAELQERVDSFVQSPTDQNLDLLQTSYLLTWYYWQKCEVFAFGPSETYALRSNLNTFPTDTAQIRTNVINGTWDLATAANVDAKGFPALDYLLNYPTEQQVVSDFQNQPLRGQYLQALAAEIASLTGTVSNEWAAGYAATFASDEGTGAGSAMSDWVNQFNFQLEMIKNARIGIPLGKKTLGSPLPDKVEAFYSKQSLYFLQTQLSWLEELYNGTTQPNQTSHSLYQILQGLDVTSNGQPLAEVLKSQFQTVNSLAQGLTGTLSDKVVSDPADLNLLHSEIQKLIILTKTDMASALGILITYQDNDGD